MRRVLLLVLTISCVATASVGIAFAVTPNAVTSAPEVRVTQFAHAGPGSGRDGDSCGVGEVDAKAFRLPVAPHGCSGTLTVSFTYRTSGDGIFSYGVRIVAPGTQRDHGVLLPETRILAPPTIRRRRRSRTG